ncbi:hypothetical protein [Rhizobium leguminosarum]|uniref:hypothetical protein n=1 Tax=Rhizobium leguminosarum TaxID=384 RepID=UPI001FF05476|nr:hypothetical protein [Rhizobium leguminosarum]
MKMMDQLHLEQDFDADNIDARKRIDAAKAKNVGNAARPRSSSVNGEADVTPTGLRPHPPAPQPR